MFDKGSQALQFNSSLRNTQRGIPLLEDECEKSAKIRYLAWLGFILFHFRA